MALNDDEILILGGHGSTKESVYIFDTRTNLATTEAVSAPFQFYNRTEGNYSIAQYEENKIVALVVHRDSWKPYLIEYVKGASSITILTDFSV